MLEHLRKFIKYLFKWGESTIPRTRIAARLGLLGSLRLTHRFLQRVSTAPPPGPKDPPRSGPTDKIPKLIWFISDVEWEKFELIPEFKKFTQVHVTDLHPVVRGNICREDVFRVVEADLKNVTPDLIFLYAREGLLSQPLFDLLRTKGVPIWGMNLDDKTEFLKDEDRPYNGRYGYCRWITSFDLNLSSSHAMMDQYRRMNARVFYFPRAITIVPNFSRSARPSPIRFPSSAPSARTASI